MRFSAARFLLALWAGKAAALAVRVLAPSRGSNITGEIALRLDPGFIAHVRGIVPERTVLITGTNGKSTSATLVAHLLRTAGLRVAGNAEGANQRGGVATALLKGASLGGRLRADALVLEVDERNLASVQRDLRARVIAVTNVQQDQVQRNGDPDYIVRKIVPALDDRVTAVLNADEPRAYSLGKTAGKVVTYGVGPGVATSPKEEFWGVTQPCPNCRDALGFSRQVIANVGHFHCPACGFASPAHPDVEVLAHDPRAATFAVGGLTLHARYNTAFFLYGYALAVAVARLFGVTDAQLVRGFETFTNIGGRYEEFSHRGVPVQYLRIKQENPETLQSAIDVIAADPTPKSFLLGLDVVNDFLPHYSNTFYTFDCDYEALAASPVERYVCFGETICFDVANRLRYAGVPDERIVILESNDPATILDSLVEAGQPKAYLITWLYQYKSLRKAAVA